MSDCKFEAQRCDSEMKIQGDEAYIDFFEGIFQIDGVDIKFETIKLLTLNTSEVENL